MRTASLVTLFLTFSLSAFANECQENMAPLLEAGDLSTAGAYFDTCEAEADQGDSAALYYLSFFYFSLPDFEPHPQKGVDAIQESAKLGFDLAQYWMGWQHEVGEHLSRDDAAAVMWYERAADSNEWLAKHRLAAAYRNGELGLPIDEQLAKNYEGD